ncbi:MAG: hypothetical protein PHX43_00515 [Alphaproteobacteria bacterium]|nr:hypothetical protein [Alphaproteobacteria bacterium]
MTNDSAAIASPYIGTQKSKAHPASAEVVATEIIQDNFSSEADREEFTQAIKMHGVTFLYLSNSPIPEPSSHELSVIDRMARSLSCFWPESLVIGGCHE